MPTVFLLYETSPSDPYEPDTLISVHASMEGAQASTGDRVLHPWGRVQADGTVSAKPKGDAYFGMKIVPVELND